nr:electron transfer flavoprotein subunit alpha/FixB family protein [Sulfobacillus harzensis]
MAEEVWGLALALKGDRLLALSLDEAVLGPTNGGVDAVYRADGWHTAQQVARLVDQVVKKEGITRVICPRGEFGLMTAARLAHLTDAALFSGVAQGSQADSVVIPIYGGQVMADVELDAPLAVFIPRARAFTAEVSALDGATMVLQASPDSNDPDAALQLLAEQQDEGPQLESASIVVSGGRGLGAPEGFERLERLAALVGGTVGASRAAVDAGWIDQSRQVGQTGVTVAPDVYFAIGISGAIQHLAGMRQAKRVVAINADPNAPIFRHADLGVVGDFASVLDGMLDVLQGQGEAQ